MNIRTMLRGKVSLLFLTLGLLLALPAAAWADATLDTSADLSTSVTTPSNVGIGDNTFKIKVWAFQGNVPSGKNGEVNVGTKYNMSTTGAITADTTSTQKVDFSNINYSSGCPTTGTIPQGCPGNPFEVTATLNVAEGTANGKTGTLTVYHAPVTDSGLTADSVPATGQVKVLIPDSTPPVISKVVTGTVGTNDWYTSNVSVDWTVSDPDSAISSQSGCADFSVTSDQVATTYTCEATSAGGTSSDSVTIKRDATKPTAVGFVNGPAANGSYPFGSVPDAPTCDANFDISGKASCDITGYSTAVSAPGTHTMTATATDNAGNVETATRSYTVTKANQAALTVDDPDSGTYGDKLAMSASGGTTGGAITFNVTSDSNACEIVTGGADDGKLSITDGTGTCKITATMAGNANYNDVTSAAHTVSVSKRAVTVTADAKTKTYGEDDPALTYDVTSGSVINNDQFTGALSRAAGEDVGTYAIQQNDLALPASKYILTYVGADLTIEPRPVTVTPNANQGKTYGESDPTLGYTLSSTFGPPALVGSDTLEGALSRAPGKDVGSYLIGLGTLSGGDNYDLSLSATPVYFEITQRPITVTAVSDTKVYDDTTSSGGAPLVTSALSPAIVVGDTANFTQAFGNQHAAPGKVLTPSGSVSDGNGGANYKVTFVTNNTGKISQRPITVSAVPDTKVYDDTTSSNKTPHVNSALDPAIAGDDVANFSQAFGNQHAGTGKTLTPSGSVNDGNGGANYLVNPVNNTNGVISARAITVTAVTDTKTYDTTNSSDETPQITSALSPAIAGNDVANFSQAFDNENAGTGKTLSPSGSVSDDNGGANYKVTPVTNNTGVILAKLLSASFTVADKVFDGNNTATITGSSITGGVLTADTDTVGISHATATATFNNELVGANKTVTGTGFTLTGLDKDNYKLPTSLTTTASILNWSLKGFYQPVDMGETLNTVKNGSTVPVKFEIFQGIGGTELTNISAVTSVVAKTVNCAAFAGEPEDPIEMVTTGGTSLRYDTTGGQFIYNWQTPKKVNTCYNLTMTAADGSPITAYFKLK